MDIRTKLVFSLVAVALGSMLALGAVTYSSARDLLRDGALDQLAGIAESKREGVERLILGWQERVQLVSSRAQLRLSLRDHDRDSDPAAPTRIVEILTDVVHSNVVEAVAVYDLRGDLIAQAPADPSFESRIDIRMTQGESPTYEGVSFGPERTPNVRFRIALQLEGEDLGVLEVVLDAQALADFTRNYEGLGETGETLIFMPDGSGGARVFHPLRHTGDSGLPVLQITDPDAPANLALMGQEAVYWKNVFDYREEPVWAATRFLPETGWGLVVKFDEAEERAPILAFRRQLTELGLTLAAFAIALGVLLGFRFAQPIHDLSLVASRIRDGDLGARATATREDEVGLLARTFNEMTDRLEEQVTLLQEYERFFDVSVEMLCIAGMDGTFKRTNPAFERVLGWTSEDLNGTPFLDFVHPDDVERTRREVEKLTQGIPTISFENRYRCADGSYRQLRWTTYPDTDSGLLYAIARDITRRAPQA